MSTGLMLGLPFLPIDLSAALASARAQGQQVAPHVKRLIAFAEEFESDHLPELLQVSSFERADAVLGRPAEMTLRAAIDFVAFFEEQGQPLPSGNMEETRAALVAAIERIRNSEFSEAALSLEDVPELLDRLFARSSATTRTLTGSVLLPILETSGDGVLGLLRTIVLRMGNVMVLLGIAEHYLRPNVPARSVGILLATLQRDLEMYDKLVKLVTPRPLDSLRVAEWGHVSTALEKSMSTFDEALERLSR